MEDKSFKKKITLNFGFDQLQVTSIIFHRISFLQSSYRWAVKPRAASLPAQHITTNQGCACDLSCISVLFCILLEQEHTLHHSDQKMAMRN